MAYHVAIGYDIPSTPPPLQVLWRSRLRRKLILCIMHKLLNFITIYVYNYIQDLFTILWLVTVKNFLHLAVLYMLHNVCNLYV